ncbi:MAG: WxcM-like domain-containing protein, partial [Zetaproteobacteria bacterium]
MVRWISFDVMGDERGKLVALEPGNPIPFEIKRVYYIYGTKPGVSRGFHAHKEFEQVAVCVSGRCRMVLDDGQRREEAWLDRPDRG